MISRASMPKQLKGNKMSKGQMGRKKVTSGNGTKKKGFFSKLFSPSKKKVPERLPTGLKPKGAAVADI